LQRAATRWCSMTWHVRLAVVVAITTGVFVARAEEQKPAAAPTSPPAVTSDSSKPADASKPVDASKPAHASEPADASKSARDDQPAPPTAAQAPPSGDKPEAKPSAQGAPLPSPAKDAKNVDTREAMCLMIESAASAHGLPLEFFARVIWQESRFQPDA